MPVIHHRPSAPTTKRATVEVFADVTCPFAHVGLRRFVGRREELGLSRPVLHVRAWPLELVDRKPLEASVVAQHVDELREQVAPHLFGGFVPDVVPESSMPALELVAAAYALTDRAGENVSLLVRDALFEQGLDISDPEVLAGIASVHGVRVNTADAKRIVLHDYEEGRRRTVRGSPEFFLDGRGWYCPSLHIEKVDDTLRIESDIETVEAFLATCFGHAASGPSVPAIQCPSTTQQGRRRATPPSIRVPGPRDRHPSRARSTGSASHRARRTRLCR